jgi:hypothetical protein
MVLAHMPKPDGGIHNESTVESLSLALVIAQRMDHIYVSLLGLPAKVDRSPTPTCTPYTVRKVTQQPAILLQEKKSGPAWT